MTLGRRMLILAATVATVVFLANFVAPGERYRVPEQQRFIPAFK